MIDAVLSGICSYLQIEEPERHKEMTGRHSLGQLTPTRSSQPVVISRVFQLFPGFSSIYL